MGCVQRYVGVTDGVCPEVHMWVLSFVNQTFCSNFLFLILLLTNSYILHKNILMNITLNMLI